MNKLKSKMGCVLEYYILVRDIVNRSFYIFSRVGNIILNEKSEN